MDWVKKAYGTGGLAEGSSLDGLAVLLLLLLVLGLLDRVLPRVLGRVLLRGLDLGVERRVAGDECFLASSLENQTPRKKYCFITSKRSGSFLMTTGSDLLLKKSLFSSLASPQSLVTSFTSLSTLASSSLPSLDTA